MPDPAHDTHADDPNLEGPDLEGPDLEGAPRQPDAEPEPCPELDPEAWERDLAADAEAMEQRALGAELERLLLRRLADAWRDLNYRHLRDKLRPPSIRLDDSARRWGAWDPSRRLITISRRQVLCYTWESVLETLRHEMAHQYVSEALGRDAEPPHGPAFQAACRRLLCDPAPRGSGGVPLFRPGGAGALEAPDDARLRRIQKLLALADNNPDEHEARAAFARAGELMLKYNLDPSAQTRADYVHRLLGEPTGRVPHHRYLIAGILQEFFFVQCIWIDTYTVHTGVRGHSLEVMGKRRNVDMAEYVHDCLQRQAESLWQAYKRAQGITRRSAKREYLDGLLSGFRRQLRETSEQSAARGLVWLGDPGLKRFAQRRHPRTTSTRLGGVASGEVRADGVEAGKALRLHKPVGEGPTASRGRLLPG